MMNHTISTFIYHIFTFFAIEFKVILLNIFLTNTDILTKISHRSVTCYLSIIVLLILLFFDKNGTMALKKFLGFAPGLHLDIT